MKQSENSDIGFNKAEKVLFTSYGPIGSQLSKGATKFAENMVGCYYKRHHSEYSNWRHKYGELVDCENEGQIKVISNEKTIYELFNLCKYSIGVYSTAIYESLMNECKTYLVDIEGCKYMEYLINSN